MPPTWVWTRFPRRPGVRAGALGCIVREELASPEQPGRQWAWTQEGSGQGSGARGCGRACLLLTTLPPAVRPGLRGTSHPRWSWPPSRLFEGDGEAGLRSREDGGFVFVSTAGMGLQNHSHARLVPVIPVNKTANQGAGWSPTALGWGVSPATQRGWWAGFGLSASGSALKESCPAPPRPRAVAS